MKYNVTQSLQYFLLIFAAALFFSGCQKDTSQDVEVDVKITSPEENQHFTAGQEIRYFAEIQSDVSIHGYELFEKNTVTGDSVFLVNKHTHGENVQVLYSWKTNHATEADIELILKVLITHEGLYKTFTRKIHYK